MSLVFKATDVSQVSTSWEDNDPSRDKGIGVVSTPGVKDTATIVDVNGGAGFSAGRSSGIERDFLERFEEILPMTR